MTKLCQDHPHLKFIVTEDSLSSNAPHIETLQVHGLHYILGVKEGDHASLFEQVQAAEHAGRVTAYELGRSAATVSWHVTDRGKRALRIAKAPPGR